MEILKQQELWALAIAQKTQFLEDGECIACSVWVVRSGRGIGSSSLEWSRRRSSSTTLSTTNIKSWRRVVAEVDDTTVVLDSRSLKQRSSVWADYQLTKSTDARLNTHFSIYRSASHEDGAEVVSVPAICSYGEGSRLVVSNKLLSSMYTRQSKRVAIRHSNHPCRPTALLSLSAQKRRPGPPVRERILGERWTFLPPAR